MEYAEYISFSYRKRQAINEYNKKLKNKDNLINCYYFRYLNICKFVAEYLDLHVNDAVFHTFERNNIIKILQYNTDSNIRLLFKNRKTNTIKYILNNYKIKLNILFACKYVYNYSGLAKRLIKEKNSYLQYHCIHEIAKNPKLTNTVKLVILKEEEGALVFATRYGFLKKVKYFIENNIDKSNILIAIKIAIRYEKISILKYLLDTKVKYDIIGSLINATENGNLLVIKFFIKLNTYQIPYERLFHTAIYYGHLDIIKYLKNRGCIFNKSEFNNLYRFILHCSLDTFKYLLENNLSDYFKDPVIIKNAFEKNRPDIADYLINYNNISDFNYDTMIIVVANSYDDKQESIKYLLDKNIKLQSIKLAIKSAINNHNETNVKCLSNYLISINYPLNDLVNFAKSKKRFTMLRYLKN